MRINLISQFPYTSLQTDNPLCSFFISIPTSLATGNNVAIEHGLRTPNESFFQKSHIFWPIGQISLFQYSGKTIASTKTNDSSKESSVTQLSGTRNKSACKNQKTAGPTFRKKHIWEWDLILGRKELGIQSSRVRSPCNRECQSLSFNHVSLYF